MALPVKKIFLDTAMKTPDSRSNSDFKVSLKESFTLPENCVFYIDDVCLPHAWYTVETGVNDRLFVFITNDFPVDSRPEVGATINLTPKIYTGADLAAEISAGLNAAGPASYATPLFSVTYAASTHTISIAAQYSDLLFRVLTSEDLATNMGGLWPGSSFDPKNPQDINGPILKQTEGTSATSGFSTPFTSGTLNLQPIRSVYLYSPNLGSFHTLGPNGEASILKAIPVSAPPNHMIFDQVMATNDYLDCSRQTLRTLEFQLRDVNGNLVPMHGSHWSFSLVFDIVDTKS